MIHTAGKLKFVLIYTSMIAVLALPLGIVPGKGRALLRQLTTFMRSDTDRILRDITVINSSSHQALVMKPGNRMSA